VVFGSLVQTTSRQIGRKDDKVVTLSGLRTLVVTTLFGRPGLQYGAKPVPVPPGVADREAHKQEVANIVHTILQRFAVQLSDREHYLMNAPSILSGIGVVANRVVTSQAYTSQYPPLSLDELLARLSEIRWEREGFWDGIGTRLTPSGKITVAGPKEVGYAVADAIEAENPAPDARHSALKVRGKLAGQAVPPYQPVLNTPGSPNPTYPAPATAGLSAASMQSGPPEYRAS
jgi:hypothetical protein